MTDMQQGASPVQTGAEYVPQPGAQSASGAERMPSLPAPELAPVTTPEAGIETGAERREQAAELQAAQADASAVAATVVAPDPSAVQPVIVAAPANDHPVAAADEDVIEKEWVDKAKQIIASTKDDPYKRNQQVNALQKDYLKKRYGKDIGAAA